MFRHLLGRAFLDHPRSVGQSYAGHLGFAWRFGGALLKGAAAALLHGLIPSLCTFTAGQTVRELHRRLEGTGAHATGAARPMVIALHPGTGDA